MDANTHQKEILLVANAGFFSRNWVKKNEDEADKRFTQKEKLIDACWNGLVPEILPECFDKTNDNALTLCDISDTTSFIELEFWDFDLEKENEFSINPYLFMEVKEFN